MTDDADASRPGAGVPDDVLAKLYRELRTVAAGYLQRGRPGQTLQPTAVVHEAYLRLAKNDRLAWDNESHFFAISARAMRNVLLDHVRDAGRQKRGGHAAKVTLAGVPAQSGSPDTGPGGVDVLALSEALDRLAAIDPRQAEVVELRFFGALEIVDVAAHLGVSERTVKNDWRMAKAWLRAELEDQN